MAARNFYLDCCAFCTFLTYMILFFMPNFLMSSGSDELLNLEITNAVQVIDDWETPFVTGIRVIQEESHCKWNERELLTYLWRGQRYIKLNIRDLDQLNEEMLSSPDTKFKIGNQISHNCQ